MGLLAGGYDASKSWIEPLWVGGGAVDERRPPDGAKAHDSPRNHDSYRALEMLATRWTTGLRIRMLATKKRCYTRI